MRPQLLKPPFDFFLNSPSPAEEEEIKQRVQTIYGSSAADLPVMRSGVRTSIRSEMRRWITLWDLHRYYLEYQTRITIEDVHFDSAQINEEVFAAPRDDEPW